MTDVTALLTNKAYGYPTRGAERRVDPVALAALHITGNPRTPPATARQERDYANRVGSNGPSAHGYMDPDGSLVWAILPKYAAWSNGALRNPKTSVLGPVLALVAQGYNPNEAYDLEIELCGRDPDFPITDEQTARLPGILVERALVRDLPITRETVSLHSDLDSVNRPNCPRPKAQGEAWLAGILHEANDLLLAAKYAIALQENDALTDSLAAANLEAARWQERAATYLAQRDVTLAWGRDLKSLMGQGLALDEPSYE